MLPLPSIDRCSSSRHCPKEHAFGRRLGASPSPILEITSQLRDRFTPWWFRASQCKSTSSVSKSSSPRQILLSAKSVAQCPTASSPFTFCESRHVGAHSYGRRSSQRPWPLAFIFSSAAGGQGVSSANHNIPAYSPVDPVGSLHRGQVRAGTRRLPHLPILPPAESGEIEAGALRRRGKWDLSWALCGAGGVRDGGGWAACGRMHWRNNMRRRDRRRRARCRWAREIATFRIWGKNCTYQTVQFYLAVAGFVVSPNL
jgi:hypothetical protein